MSQKKPSSKAAGAPKNLSEKQIRRIWAELKPQPLLDKLRGVQPAAKWTASGSRLSGCCPYHDESTPSFHIYLERGYARCFGCEKFVSNPIELWAKIRQSGRVDALLDLRQQFGLKFLSGTMNTQLEAWERNQLVKQRIVTLCHDELVNAIGNPANPLYAQAQPTVRYLLSTRSIPKDAIPSLPMLGVMPPLGRLYDALDAEAKAENERRTAAAEESGERVAKFTSLTADAQAYLQQITINWVGAIVFRLDVAPDTMGRIKLRRPDSKDFLILNDHYEEDLGFFGLSWPLYKSLLGAQQKYVMGAYHVEGEFDALSIMARQVEAGGPGFVTVSGGGSAGGGQIDLLKHCGFEEIYLVGDAPNKKGDELIAQWLPEVHQLRGRIFIGHDRFPGASDPDEAVIVHGLDAVQRAFLDTTNLALFTTPQDWCFEKAAPDLAALQESDIRQRIEYASRWGKLLRNVYECDAFVTRCAEEFQIPAHLLKRDIVAKEENEPAFILRIVDILSQLFSVVGQQATDNDRRLYLWYKEGKRVIQISLADDGSAERELGTTLGPAYQVFQEKIGVPSFLEPTQGATAAYLQKQDQALRWYLRQALTHMAMHAPDFHSAPHKGQGIHAVRDPQGGPPTLYLVNGRDVYVGVYDVHGALSWKVTDGPVHNGIVFDVGTRAPAQPIFDWITKPEDLDHATTLDPKALYTKLHRILDIGWTFKDHALTVDFLTAHLLSVTVSDAFRRKVFMGVHADTSAGKSRLLMGLIGGTDFPRIHLIAAARGMPSYTAAGIRQTTNNSSRPLCLDEFEDEGLGDKKGRLITEVFEMYRNLNGENNSYTMGQRGGDPITYTLNYPVFIAAINKAKKVQDANRTITVSLKKVPNRPDPQQVLIQTYGVQVLEQLKRDLAIALLPHIARLQATYREIEIEYGQGSGNKLQLDQRYFEGLYPALTMMKFLGLSYQTFLTDFCEANKEAFRFGATHTDSMELFYYVCQSPKLTVRDGSNAQERVNMSLVQLLSTQETREQINLTNSGLYFDEVEQVLLVNWTAAVQVVLAQHPKYSRESNLYNLRDLANRAPHVVPPDELVRTGVLSRLKSHGIGAVPTGYLTGYRLRETINNLSSTPVLDDAPPDPVVVPVIAPAPTPAAVVNLPTQATSDDNFDFDR